MNILIVTAHPSSRGFTHAIARTFAEQAEKSGHTVEVQNLYKTDLQQDFVKFEDVRSWEGEDIRQTWQAKISAADELVIVHPIWWFDTPAVLKNWFDQNFTSGYAYKYRQGGHDKLLSGKRVRIFATGDGPAIFYTICKQIFKSVWARGRYGFCGYKIMSFEILSQKRKRSETELDNFLKKVARIARSS